MSSTAHVAARPVSVFLIGKRTDSLAATAVLFGVMAAHALLETGRDALFLARLGPGRLAWAYVAIACCALLAVTAVRRWAKVRDSRRMLIAFLIAATAGTTLLAATITLSSSLVFVLYVWTGLVATLVVPCFWTLVDRSLAVDEAKRVFARIGAGGVLGALVGSALASLLGRFLPAQHLITAGAVAFTLATAAAIVLAPRPLVEAAASPNPRRGVPSSRRSHRYVALLAGLAVVSTIALTLGDLTFKHILADELPPAQLATVFGAIYTGLNVVGLAVQLLVAPRLLARLGVGTVAMILPILMLTAALGFAATGALVAVIVLKMGDGGLRHSLHRVTSEILYLAIPSRMRDAAKPIADAVGQRGGQVIAALLVLLIGAALDGGSEDRGLAAAAAVAAVVWLALVAVVRVAYVAQFRDMLTAGELHQVARVPELDAQSIELLLQALASPDEVEALAALELLEGARDRVPALVLFDPRKAVVRRALRLLAQDRRPEIACVVAHLLDHEDPEIRASALARATGVPGQRQLLVAALADPHPEVRAAAAIGLAGDVEHGAAAMTALSAMLSASTAERVAVSHAICRRPDERMRGPLAELLEYREPAVMRDVLDVYRRAPHLADLARLLAFLEDPHVRGDVRRVFVAAGPSGLALLVDALDDPRTPVEVRRHLPRTISRCQSPHAAAVLVARLRHEPDRMTEFKIIRALGRMTANDPKLSIDKASLEHYVQRSISEAARFATLHDHLDDGSSAMTGTPLLRELLADKRRQAIDRVFRALGILHPTADLRSVHDALMGADVLRHGAARELLETVLAPDVRGSLFAVLDELSPDARRERLGQLAPGPFATYEALLGELLDDASESLRCLAAFHIAERRLVSLREVLIRTRPLAGPQLVIHAFDQAIARLDERP